MFCNHLPYLFRGQSALVGGLIGLLLLHLLAQGVNFGG